jgi:hypothetical protein
LTAQIYQVVVKVWCSQNREKERRYNTGHKDEITSTAGQDVLHALGTANCQRKEFGAQFPLIAPNPERIR